MGGTLNVFIIVRLRFYCKKLIKYILPKRDDTTEDTPVTKGPQYQKTAFINAQKLATLRRKYPNKIHLRAPTEATLLELHVQAANAARIADLDAHITTATGQEKAVPQWDEHTIWDPGD